MRLSDEQVRQIANDWFDIIVCDIKAMKEQAKKEKVEKGSNTMLYCLSSDGRNTA